ncbi:uncharacterized protein LOC132546279 [Ylistrum balloti]|uniref:uncharacterized protein LOC132546279 n=1 Tax=Ylistrum balloti TaxID=509963 RepID=UPI002905B0EE|nr:uncharacterized protein LOC132546279 [Ylistrum balloti]
MASYSCLADRGLTGGAPSPTAQLLSLPGTTSSKRSDPSQAFTKRNSTAYVTHKTATGDSFLFIDDGDISRILAFATTDNLTNLATADRIFCDGTFYTCPSLFHQIYSIHIEIDGSMFPVIYALLPGKSQTIYTRFFTLLKTAMADLHLPMTPATVFVDFETAVHNAIRTVFPGTEIKGCFFHFTQCIWRKAQTTGLQLPYRDNDDTRRLVRRAAVLPLVPRQKIEDVWFNALEDIEDADLPADVTPFTDYVVDQWIDGDRTIWNHYETEGPSTTNHLEAWHGKLKRMVQHARSNIYAIIQIFKDIQTANDITRLQRQAAGTQRPRSRKYQNIEIREQHNRHHDLRRRCIRVTASWIVL